MLPERDGAGLAAGAGAALEGEVLAGAGLLGAEGVVLGAEGVDLEGLTDGWLQVPLWKSSGRVVWVGLMVGLSIPRSGTAGAGAALHGFTPGDLAGAGWGAGLTEGSFTGFEVGDSGLKTGLSAGLLTPELADWLAD